MNRTLLCLLALGLGVGLAGTLARGDDKKKADAAVDEKAMIEAMMKAATPGEHHKVLEQQAGSWDVEVTMWMDPAKPPTVSKATCEAKMILGGRYLEEVIKGEFGGMPFEGRGTTGYDNLQKQYVSTWIDNMGTGISQGVGHYDAAKKTMITTRENIDPATGKAYKGKDVVTFKSKDHYESTMYNIRDGKEMKAMHIVAKRRK